MVHARLFPEAGEGIVAVVPWPITARPAAGSRATRPSDPGKRAANARRACGKLRRYVRANACRLLWTLTFAEEPESRAAVAHHLGRFWRALRDRYGRLPFCAVIERGNQTGRLHVHFVTDRFLSIEAVRALWGHGHVWVGDDRRQNGRMPLRMAARYLAKYLRKQIEEEGDEDPHNRAHGQHRYFLAQGFQPLCRKRRFGLPDQAYAWLVAQLGQPETVIPWQSEGAGGVVGVWVCWDDRSIARWRRWGAKDGP